MSQTTTSQTISQTTMTVRLSGELSDYAASNIGESGTFENMSEYIRSLIRHDKERSEKKAFNHLKAELDLAFATPDEYYSPLTANDIFERN
jgi:antitoxin ParD1/3/4